MEQKKTSMKFLKEKTISSIDQASLKKSSMEPLKEKNISSVEQFDLSQSKVTDNQQKKDKDGEIVLTKDQESALISIINRKNVFITGPGGTGKTLLITYLIQNYSDLIRSTLDYSGIDDYELDESGSLGITSMTGVSAILLGGSTLHSWAGIGLGTSPIGTLVAMIKKNAKARERWKNVSTLVIDEVSMLDPVLFDTLNDIAKIMKKNTRPFGGIQLVLVGDMLQLPVVNKTNFCFESKTWEKCDIQTIQLTEIVRQQDKDFQDCLNKLRYGIVDETVKEVIGSRIGAKLDTSLGIEPTKIYPLNRDVDYINNERLQKLVKKTNDIFEYEMEVKIKDSSVIKQIPKLKKSCPAVDVLNLTTGCQVMLLCNTNIECGLANGSRGVVVGFINDLPQVRFLNGREVVVDFYTWEIEEKGKSIASISQIPLKLAWAVSIHKQQGSTLDYAIVDLSNIFEYGMGYVALSRVKNLSGLSIVDIDWDKIRAHPKAIEFYSSVLSNK